MVTAKLARPEILMRIKERLGFDGLEVYGMYDVVIESEANSIQELHRKINEIDRMGIVRGTETFIVAREGKRKEVHGVNTFAYVLIDTSPGGMEEAQSTVADLGEVKKADIVFGPFDVIVDVAVKNMDELNEVMRKIVSLDSVHKTCTLISSRIH